LKEPDLEAVLCDPQLRQFFLWQEDFIVTYIKCDQAELYWTAITRELERHCTCITWDELGCILVEPVCACSDLRPPPHVTTVILPNSPPKTLRTVSRISHLFPELLKILLSVIQLLPRSYFGGGNPALLVKVIRKCFDVLEFTKLVSTRFIRLEAFLILVSNITAVGHRGQPTPKPPPSPLVFHTRHKQMGFQDKNKKRENMDFAITRAWMRKFTQLSTPTRPKTTDPQASANAPVLSVDPSGSASQSPSLLLTWSPMKSSLPEIRFVKYRHQHRHPPNSSDVYHMITLSGY
jgi:hypothetical protein